MSDIAKLGFSVDTSALKKGEKALDSFAATGEKTEKRTGKSSGRITDFFNDVNSAIGRTATQMLKTESTIDRSTRAIEKDFKSMNNTMSTTSKLLTGMAGLFALVGVQQAAASVVDYSDSWKNVNSQIRQVTDSEEDLISTRNKLLGITKDTRIELSSTVNLYTEMTRGTSELDISSNRLMGVTKTLNNLFLAGGKPISETIGAIRQLNQGFASGVLRGDEFNSVAEGAPKVLDALTKSLGITRGELRDFAATGGITAQIMIDALEDYAGTASGLASKVEKTFGQSILVAKTNMTEFVGQSELLNSVIGSAGGSIIALSENLDALSSAGTVLVGAIAAGLVPSIISYTAKQYSLITSQLLLNTTTVTTSNVMGVVTARMATATVATNALAMATRFLLSPLGLIVSAVGLATTVFFSLKKSTVDLKENTSALKEEVVENINVFDEYVRKTNLLKNANLSGLGLSSLQDQFNKSTSLVETYTKRLERLNDVNASSARKSALLLKLNAEKSSIEKIITLMPQAVEGYTKLTSAEQSLVDKLDPAAAATRKLVENQLALTDAHKRGAISAAELATLNKALQDNYDKSIEKADPTTEAFNKITASLANQMTELSLSADAFELYSAKMALGVDATPAMLASIEAQVLAIQKLRKEQELKPENTSMTDLTSEVEGFGGAWTRTGSAIVDAFGDISDSISDYMSQTSALDKLQTKINDKRNEEGADLIALNKLQEKVNYDKSMSELGGIKSVASASASLFDEKTAAAKAFAAIEQAIGVAQIAMSIERMLASTAETALTVANEGAKQSALATTAIVSQGQGDPYTAFVRIAAMTSLMASLIGGLSSGGGSTDPTEGAQASQGTGTVFGSDEKSQSIVEAQDLFEDLQLDQLTELKAINSSMSSLTDGISSLATSLIRGSSFEGSGINLEGSNFLDSSIGSTLRKIDISALILDGLGLSGLADSIFSGFSKTRKDLLDSGLKFGTQSLGEILSGGIEGVYYDVIKTTKSKLWGLSSSSSVSTETSSIESAVLNEFSSIFSLIADSAKQSIEVLGLETSRSIDDFNVNLGTLSFEGLDGDEIQDELEAIFSQQSDLMAKYLIPSIADYQEVGEGLFETLTRVTVEQTAFNSNIEKMGAELSNLSSVIQIDIAQSVISLVGGLEEFTELSESFFDNFFSDAEKFSFIQADITEVFSSLGLPVATTTDAFRGLVQGLDLTTQSGQEAYAALLEINSSVSEFIEGLQDAATSAYSMLEDSIELEQSRALAVLDAAKDANTAEIERLDALQDALDEELEIRQSALDDSTDALNSAFSEEMELIQSNSNARIDALNSESDAINDTISSMESLIDSITSSVDSSSSTDLVGALSAAMTGDFSAAQNLDISSLTNIDSSPFSTASDLAVQEALNANRLNEIALLAGDQLTESELALQAIENQIAAEEENTAAELSAMQEQLDALLGIDTSILSISDAITQFNLSQAELSELNYEIEQAKLDLLVTSAADVLAVHQQHYDDEIERFNTILSDNEMLLAAAVGINLSVLSVNDSIVALNDSISAINESGSIPQPVITENPSSEPSAEVEAIASIAAVIAQNETVQERLLVSSASVVDILQSIRLGGLDTRQE